MGRVANAEHGPSAAGEKSMRMLSGRMHWLTVGLTLLVSAQTYTTTLQGQAPTKPGSKQARESKPGESASYAPAAYSAATAPRGMPMMGGAAGGMPPGGPGGPMSVSFPGPAPMEVGHHQHGVGGHPGVYPGAAAAGYSGQLGCGMCGGSACGGRGCGPLAGMGSGMGCPACGGGGCNSCLGGGGSLFSGRIMRLLGPLAPYAEGGGATQRWYDIYAGTIGLARTSDFGGFQSGIQNPVTGEFFTTDLISTEGINGTPALRTSDLDMDQIRYGLELIAALQLGPGSNLEVRYFGLNNWEANRTVRLQEPDLYSIFSIFGTDPAGGFDDTDRSFIHTIQYSSELHNGEVNYRRRYVTPFQALQGSWLGGIRYFDLDERFVFDATGSNDNTFTFDQLRFADYEVQTRNQMTGVQIGGDLWLTLVPGLAIGAETKGGIFGNHAESESQFTSNSIPGAREFLQTGQTAYLAELTASAVYRLTYSWSVRASYNLLYVDNVALAPENVNTRDFSNAVGGGVFTPNRFAFIDTDGEVTYQGWSIGGEFLY